MENGFGHILSVGGTMKRAFQAVFAAVCVLGSVGLANADPVQDPALFGVMG